MDATEGAILIQVGVLKVGKESRVWLDLKSLEQASTEKGLRIGRTLLDLQYSSMASANVSGLVDCQASWWLHPFRSAILESLILAGAAGLDLDRGPASTGSRTFCFSHRRCASSAKPRSCPLVKMARALPHVIGTQHVKIGRTLNIPHSRHPGGRCFNNNVRSMR